MITTVLGPIVGNLLLVMVVTSIFACGLVIMISGSRLVWAMSRDERFPGWQILHRVSLRLKTPVSATIFFALVGQLILALFGLQTDTLFALFGAVRFFTLHASGTIGPPFPRSYIDELYQTTGGDIRVVEQRLGLNPGDFDNVQVAVIERPIVQIPTGKELGANANWIPGGYTSGGIPEAVIPGQLKTDQVKIISIAELFNGN